MSRPSWRYLPTVAFGGSNAGPVIVAQPRCTLTRWTEVRLAGTAGSVRSALIELRDRAFLIEVGSGVINPPGPAAVGLTPQLSG